MSQYDDELRALLDEGRSLEGDRAPRRAPAPRPTAAAPAPPTVDLSASATAASVDVEEQPPATGGATGPRGRPTAALQHTWIDAEDVPFTPVVRPGRELPARLFSLLVLAAVVAFLAWMIIPEVSFRVTNIDTVGARNGVLTAQPVPLASPTPAIVQELWLDPADPPTGLVPQGTIIARMTVVSPEGEGSATSTMTMPFDGRIASIDTITGAVTQPESPVVTVYDPAHMYVVVSVSSSTLRRLRQGMRATLSSSLVADEIAGTVVSAVPMLGDSVEPADEAVAKIRIRPDADAVEDLVPGIRFDASIDTTSAPEGALPLVVASAPAGG